MRKRGRPAVVKTLEKYTKRPDVEVLALQLLADGIDRIDTIVHEIRHLQTNLIYAMRFWELHAALRYEESYIFGSVEVVAEEARSTRQRNLRAGEEDRRPLKTTHVGWTDFFKNYDPILTDDRFLMLADVFVPVLPKPETARGFAERNPDAGLYSPEPGQRPDVGSERHFDWLRDVIDWNISMKDVIAPITRELRRREIRGDWDDLFQMNYELFMALQLLKREAVLNRLFLCRSGADAFSDAGRRRANGGDPMGEFMVVRSVILRNIYQHVERLSDFHAQFEKTLDIGSQENHRPITGRRREQGIYHHVLSMRTKESFVQSTHFVASLLDTDGTGEIAKIFRDMPVIVHRWKHSYSSENAETLSTTRSRRIERNPERYGKVPYFGAFAINTSFWMPDRPDLQSVIAHEAAHCVILEAFGDLGTQADTAGLRGPLPDLIQRLLESARTGFRKSFEEVPDLGAGESLVREIIADLVALSVTGPAYLFALFQELIGHGIDRIAGDARVRNWRNPLLAISRARHGWGSSEVDLDWYPRIMVMCHILKDCLRDEERNAMTDGLIAGAEGCCEVFLDHVRHLVGGRSKAVPDAITDLTARLIKAYDNTLICDRLQELRQAQFANNGADGDQRDIPQSLFNRFPEDVRRRLLEYFIERKSVNRDRLLRDLFTTVLRNVDGADGDYGPMTPVWAAMRPAVRRTRETWDKDRVDGLGVKALLRTDPRAAADAILWFNEAFTGGRASNAYNLIDQRNEIAEMTKKFLAQHRVEQPQQLKKEDAAKLDKKTRTHLDSMLGKVPLFERLGDIAWQASLMRGYELLLEQRTASRYRQGAARGLSQRTAGFCVVQALSGEFAPGRETIQLAVEIWTHLRREQITDLAEASRLVRDVLGLPNGPGGTGKLDVRVGDASLLETMMGNDEEVRPQRSAMMLQEVSQRLEGGPADFRGLFENDPGIEKDIKAWKARLADLKAFLPQWLGNTLDADFVEHEFAKAMERWIKAPAASEKLPDDSEQVSQDIQRKQDRRKLARRKLGMRRRALFRSAAGRDLSDDINMGFRVFELEYLADRVGKTRDQQVRPKQLARDTATLQLLKLQTGYPTIDFGYQPKRVFLIEVLGAKTAEDVLKQLRLAAEGSPETSEHFVSLFPALSRFRRAAIEEVQGQRAQGLRTQFCERDVRFMIIQVGRFIAARLKALLAHHDEAVQLGAKSYLEPAFNYTKTIPPHRRQAEEIDYRQRLVDACQVKAEELDLCLCGQRYTGEMPPPNAIFSEFMPLYSLTRQTTVKGRGDIVTGFFKMLSRPGAGLRHFRILSMSRQSLIHAHWWREIGETDRLLPDVVEAARRSGREDPDALKEVKMQADWDHERLNNAVSYMQFPHQTDREMDDDDPPGMRRFATLGRYDYFAVSNDGPVSHVRGAVMDPTIHERAERVFSDGGQAFSRIQRERIFRSYFERRERAVHVSIRKEPANLTAPTLTLRREVNGAVASEAEPTDVLAFLSVRLSRRAERLGFMERLRKARRDWKVFQQVTSKMESQGEAKNDLTADVPFKDSASRDGHAINPFEHLLTRRRIAMTLVNALLHNPAISREDLEPLFDPAWSGRAAYAKVVTSLGLVGIAKEPERVSSALHGLVELTRTAGDLPDLPLEAAGAFLVEGDSAMLGEGWGDAIIAIHTTPSRPNIDLPKDDKDVRPGYASWLWSGQRRLFDVFAIQHTLFQDPGVFRTEMFIRPIAIPYSAMHPEAFDGWKKDAVAGDRLRCGLPGNRFQISQAIRTREDRGIGGLIQTMIDAVRDSVKIEAKWRGRESVRLRDNIRLGHIPGRNDLEIIIDNLHLLSDNRFVEDPDKPDRKGPNFCLLTPSDALEFLHRLTGAGPEAAGGGSEEIITRIGFRHFIVPE